MSPEDAQMLGWVGFALLTFSALCAGMFVLALIASLVRDHRERKWQARCARLSDEWDAGLLERRLREDAEVAALDDAYYLPAAPGSLPWRRTA